MAKPLPEWIPRVAQMQPGEVIIISTGLSRQTVKWHVNKVFRSRVREVSPGEMRIERIA